MVKRILQERIESCLFKGKAIIIYGARQVGKTTLINNLNPLQLRQDTWHLWENFMVSERLKRNAMNGYFVNTYFWRTHQQQEIDYLEEQGGTLSGFEFKWQKSKGKIPKAFLNAYPESRVEIINNQNFWEFVGLA